MSLEGFQMAWDAFEDVFSGDYAPDFVDQSAVLDGVLEAAEGMIREFEVTAEGMAKLMAILATMGAVILSALFVGGRWIVKVRFG